MRNRKRVRGGLKVIHRHRVGKQVFRRVSELVYVEGQPRIVLGWIDFAGLQTPIYLGDLQPRLLRRAHGIKDTFYYDGVTVDPRFADMQPLPRAAAMHGP